MNAQPNASAMPKVIMKSHTKRRQAASSFLKFAASNAKRPSKLEVDEVERCSLAGLEHACGGYHRGGNRERRQRAHEPVLDLVCGRNERADKSGDRNELRLGEPAGESAAAGKRGEY